MRSKTLAAVIALALGSMAPSFCQAVSLQNEAARQSDGLLIRRQLKAWDNALLEGKPQVLESILSSEYSGGGVPRDIYVQAFQATGVKYTESIRDNVEIRFYGDTAIVTGQWTQRGTTAQFGSFTSTFHFTDLWIKQGDSWKCVATSPDKVRQVYESIKPIRIGPDVTADVVILFASGALPADIESFRSTHLSKRPEPPDIESYLAAPSIDGHAVVALQLGGEYSELDRKFFIQALLREQLVFRVFENIAPAEIRLAK